MAQDTLDTQAETLADQIRDGFGTRGRSLEARAAKARRALPKHVRRDIEVIAQAQTLQDNPKLARQIDPNALGRAYRNASGWLGTVDRSAQRKTAALNVLSDIAFKLFVVVAVFLAVVIARDLL